MSTGSRVSLYTLGLAGCAALAACGTSPPTHYYVLDEIVSSAPAAAANQVMVRVEPVQIAPELDRLEIVSRIGPNRIRIAEQDRWGAPLEDQIRRVISEDLTTRLPPRMVADPAEPPTNAPRRLLTLAIVDFYADQDCAVTLRASWTLSDTNAGNGNESDNELVHIPASGPCAGPVPGLMSQALATLADRLAAAILSKTEH